MPAPARGTARILGAAVLLALSSAAGAQVRAQDSAPLSDCVPRGTEKPTYKWAPLHILPHGPGIEKPTPESVDILKPHQTSQIALDTVRNVRIAFISGATLEAPAGSEDWSVVQTPTCPPARWAGAMAYDPVNDEIVLWGGTLSIDGPTDDTWIYDPRTRDWRVLDSGAASLRDLRVAVGTFRDGLETLRWDLWKALEWKATGKQGAPAESELHERLQHLQAELAALEVTSADAAGRLEGYEKAQALGAHKWLASANAALARIGSGIAAGTAEGLEGDYRAVVALRPDVLTAADSVRFAPPSRHFVSLTHDPSLNAFVLGRTVEATQVDSWIYRLAERRWERTDPPPGSPVTPPTPTGEFVLRDAASVAELQQWRAQTSAWAAALPSNTWVKAPAHGTGRPNWGRSWSSIVYDPDREQLYYRDGGHGSYHGNITDHYDIRTGRWFRSDIEQVPDGRIIGTYFGWGRGYNYAPWAIHTYKWNLFYNPVTKHLQRPVFHSPNRLKSGNTNDYDPDRGAWSREPATVERVGPVVPGVPDGIVSVRGWQRYGGLPSATVTYQTASGVKTWSNTGPIPFPGSNHDDAYAYVFDPRRERVMYYGGEGAALGLFVLELRGDRPRWEKLPVSADGGGRLPPPYREWIYIPRHDVFLTMEWRAGPSKAAPKVWSFDPTTNLFRPVDLALGPGVAVGEGAGNLRSPSVAAGLAYDPVSDVAFYIHTALGPPTMFAFRYVPGEP